jgi:hypothetical protein
VLSWFNLLLPPDTSLRLVPSGAGNLKHIWNQVVKDFLKTDDEWLLSAHHDVVFAPETLLRLLSWNKPLISALIFMRQSPVIPHIWRAYDGHIEHMTQRIQDTKQWFYSHPDWIKFGAFVMDPRPEDALVKVDFTSTSLTLIHRSVLETMRPYVADVWFEMDDEIKGGGEDRRFFENAKMAGFDAYVDRSCVAGHLVGDVPTSVADFIAWEAVSTFEGTGEQVTQ